MSEITGVADTGPFSGSSGGAYTPQGPCASFISDAEITDDEICRVASGETEGATPQRVAELRAAATDIVWVLLGRPNIGVCEATVYPTCREHCWRYWNRTQSTLGMHTGCAGCGVDGILLDTPVIDVTEVTLDGEVLPLDEVALVDGCWLVRLGHSWPAGAIDENYTDFSITYSFGEVPSQLVKDATVEMVVDLWKSRPGYGKPFPAHASSVSRQQVSFNLEQEVERAEKAGMSLPALTKAVAVYNPSGQPFPTFVWSPDGAMRTRTVRTFP